MDDFDFLDNDEFLQDLEADFETLDESESSDQESWENASFFEEKSPQYSSSFPRKLKLPTLNQFDRTQKIILGVLAGFAILLYIFGFAFITRDDAPEPVDEGTQISIGETGTAIYLEGQVLLEQQAVFGGTATAQAFQHQLNVAFTLTVGYDQTQVAAVATLTPTATNTLPPLPIATSTDTPNSNGTQTPEPSADSD